MKRHILKRVSQQIELASQDSPDVEDMPAANLEGRRSCAIIVAESATMARHRFHAGYFVGKVHA
jgi:hypothetical protein